MGIGDALIPLKIDQIPPSGPKGHRQQNFWPHNAATALLQAVTAWP